MVFLSRSRLGLQEQAIHLTTKPSLPLSAICLQEVSERSRVYLETLNSNNLEGQCISHVVDAALVRGHYAAQPVASAVENRSLVADI